MKLKDMRTKLTNEILNGIKVLKLYAWEGAFQTKLFGIREKELQMIKKAAFFLSGTVTTFNCAPVMVYDLIYKYEVDYIFSCNDNGCHTKHRGNMRVVNSIYFLYKTI